MYKYKVFEREFEIPAQYNTETLKQGYWGEQWVSEFFKSCNHKIIWPKDRYEYFDFYLQLANGQLSTIQVKTVTRYVKNNYYKINDGVNKETLNNIKKCDTLILVTRTPNHVSLKEDKEFEGKVFIVKKHKNISISNNSFIIPSTEKYLIHLGTLTSEELKQVNSFNTQK